MKPIPNSDQSRAFTKHYFRINNEVIDQFLPLIGFDGLALYCLLCRYSYNRPMVQRFTSNQLCKKLGVGRTKLFELLKLLDTHRLILRKNVPGRRSVITLLDTKLAIAGLARENNPETSANATGPTEEKFDLSDAIKRLIETKTFPKRRNNS
jgi:hypothetical protein